ncbi:hypothetical protein [Methanoregula sp.]|uniref:hypothetical protein n=1 Tax=Methanoregula sp. TaxID=2052170 RepID=UPI003FD7F573
MVIDAMIYQQNFFLLENKITGDSPEGPEPGTDHGNLNEYLSKIIHKNTQILMRF